MRLLFVGKRRPQQRDLIERPYGRFHYLPVALADLGHEVTVLLCSHHGLPSIRRRMSNVNWICEDVLPLGPTVLVNRLARHASAFRPDWVIGVSDSYYGWLARRLARSTGASCAVDAYDNYEAYMPWNLPLHMLWRGSVRTADLVTAAGPQLAQLLQSYRRGGRPAELIPMAADPEFKPLDKQECRRTLGLSPDARLAGYVGSWAKNRGTDVLLKAFRRARAAQPKLQLVLSGRPPQWVLQEPGVITTGYVSDAQLPVLINALDVACVVTADTSFGRYSYPAKLCEAVACEVPVVATATEPVRWMLGNRDQHLVSLNDPNALADRILDQLAEPRAEYGPRETWNDHARRLSQLLEKFSGEKQ